MPIPVKEILGAVAPIVGAGMGLIGRGAEDRRQIKQQQKLTDMQADANKKQAEYQNKLAMDMWRNTNYSAQRNEMEKAGLSVSNMYSQSGGGGGATTGGANVAGVSAGQAPNSAQTTANKLQAGMQMAQMGLMMAQKENIEADTKKKNADVGLTGENTTSVAFDNAVKKAIGVSSMYDRYQMENEAKERENAKGEAEWMTKARIDYEGKQFDDPTSPKAKALKAELEMATEKLKQAKTDNNIKLAEETVKNFEANMAKQGLSPNTPWWGKMIADLLIEAGVNPMKTVSGIIKK